MSFWSTITETPGQTKQSILFTEGVTFTVNAAADEVFDAITDFPNYGRWNTWSPSFKFDGGDGPKAGSQGVLSAVALKRNYTLPVRIIKLESSPDKHVLAFRGLLLPSWVAVVERVHVVVPAADGRSCEVTSWESMGGWGAYILKFFFSAVLQVKDANEKFSADLKLYMENK
ncbi:hypothetical protein NLG97_g3798 [Lecanicillium saksenae]|uniref:Uncharacterized protein n=1 Tax=Lecanicillium saksenae TaxID=468837 RepID=A0ACC1QZQ8_9HYPO|nr:hypothetical protein NLG97_g3798 [Lecanicillium saksenae]